jgi:hypothetical protein
MRIWVKQAGRSPSLISSAPKPIYISQNLSMDAPGSRKLTWAERSGRSPSYDFLIEMRKRRGLNVVSYQIATLHAAKELLFGIRARLLVVP